MLSIVRVSGRNADLNMEESSFDRSDKSGSLAGYERILLFFFFSFSFLRILFSYLFLFFARCHVDYSSVGHNFLYHLINFFVSRVIFHFILSMGTFVIGINEN